MKKKVKFKVLTCALTSLLLTIGMSLNYPVFAADKTIDEVITPDYVVVCPVHKVYHAPSSAAFTKFAFTKGGKLYNASQYTCDCGTTIYFTNDLPNVNYYWYSGTTYWTMPYYLPGAMQYIVPSKIYTTTNSNPPNWKISSY